MKPNQSQTDAVAIAKTRRLLLNREGCECHQCHKLYTVDLMVPDDVWRQIATDGEMLCGRCIGDRMEQRLDFAASALIDLACSSALSVEHDSAVVQEMKKAKLRVSRKEDGIQGIRGQLAWSVGYEDGFLDGHAAALRIDSREVEEARQKALEEYFGPNANAGWPEQRHYLKGFDDGAALNARAASEWVDVNSEDDLPEEAGLYLWKGRMAWDDYDTRFFDPGLEADRSGLWVSLYTRYQKIEGPTGGSR